jgi:GLPGLI family protein
MNKKIIFILGLIFSINTLLGQDSIRLILEYKMVHVIDTNQRTNPRVFPCMLLAGSNMSVFDDYYRTLRYLGYSGVTVDRVYNDPNDIQDLIAGISCDQIFTDFGKYEQVTGSYIAKNLYAIKAPLPEIAWTIQSQKKQILGQECQRATADFRGRHYTAWFAPGIPVHTGPWKLQGLPGLILAANDDANEVSFTCTKITVPEKEAPLIAFSKKATLLKTADELKRYQKTFGRDPNAGQGMSDPRGTIVAFTTPIGYDANQTKAKPRPMNNPIERE